MTLMTLFFHNIVCSQTSAHILNKHLSAVLIQEDLLLAATCKVAQPKQGTGRATKGNSLARGGSLAQRPPSVYAVMKHKLVGVAGQDKVAVSTRTELHCADCGHTF